MPPDLRRSGRTLLGLALLGAAPAAAQEGPWALTNARIETVTRGVIERGTILIRDGLIQAVGPGLTVPPDARVLDLAGKTVSPGLIDLSSSMGLPAAPAAGGGGGGGGGFGGGLGAQALAPERLVVDEVRIPPADARSAREAGFTAVLVAPARGLFRGRSALMPLRDSVDGTAAIRSPVGQHMGYQGVGGGQFPGSLMGIIAAQRQWLYDAQRYAALMERWNSSPRGMSRPERDPRLEGLVPAAAGREPVFAEANSENEIRRAALVARELGIRLVVVGATEGWRALPDLQGAGVVVSVNYPRPQQVTGWRYRGSMPQAPGDTAEAAAQAQRLIEGNAAALHRAGIRFALASGGARPSEVLPNVRKAVAAGLPAQTGLEALTIRAAELAGAGDVVGSIEAGKIANLVVSTGPILTDTARVTGVFVDGIWHEGPPPAARRAGAPGGGRAGGPGGAGPPGMAQVGGTWALVTNSPQGMMEGTLTVAQEGASFTGTMTSQMGDAPITDGRISGRRITWTIALSFGGQSFTLAYAAEVDGNRMAGDVTLGEFGTFTFTGEKRP